MWEPGYEDNHRQWREEQDQWWQDVEERETRRLEIEAAVRTEDEEKAERRAAEAEQARDEERGE